VELAHNVSHQQHASLLPELQSHQSVTMDRYQTNYTDFVAVLQVFYSNITNNNNNNNDRLTAFDPGQVRS